MPFTYFVITPGSEVGSTIKFPKGPKGNYFKFGDTSQASTLGVRTGYQTHAPDFGVAAVLNDQMQGGARLGTQIKKDIVQDGWQLVPNTEWFSVKTSTAWALFDYMLKQYGKKIDNTNYQGFIQQVIHTLNNN